jgi:hypothetical protein
MKDKSPVRSSESELDSLDVRCMKRTLVSYGGDSSASESESETSPHPNKRPNPPPPPPSSSPPPPGTKQQRHKRKLPALAAHLAPTVPPDDPSKHQGRTRTTPHVDGQWAAYVYVPIALRGSSTAALRRVVERAVGIAKTAGETGIVPVHTLGSSGSGSGDVVEVCDELHVSLTRPFFLRAYQREEMKRAVRDVAKAHSP